MRLRDAIGSQVRLQRPTVSAEMSFLLAVLKFYVPSAASSGATPIPFHSEDVLLTGTPAPNPKSSTIKLNKLGRCLVATQQGGMELALGLRHTGSMT